MENLTRRSLLGLMGGSTAIALTSPMKAEARSYLVVGGGPGGSTAAMALKRQSPYSHVTLLERDPTKLARAPQSFALLKEAGIHVAVEEVMQADWEAGFLLGLSGRRYTFDHTFVAPGISFLNEGITGYDARTAHLMPHAWRRGRENGILGPAVQALPEGGTIIIRVPDGDISHGQGPYVRATEMAKVLSQINPKAKVLLLDEKKSFPNQRRFEAQWADIGNCQMVEWVPTKIEALDGHKNRLLTSQGWIKGDFINFIPAQRAGDIAHQSGLTNETGWCPVDRTSYRSQLVPRVSVLGDAVWEKSTNKTVKNAQAQALEATASLRPS